MSRREPERDRDPREEKRRAPPTSTRSHEYFVPKDGIDREVITADICRYLGNDALVRPGNYENPQTRQIQAGYFITAYRNLTTAMIADLKLDSERWEAERRAASEGRPINAPRYITSRTHESRQYYGHQEAPPPPPPQGFASNSGPPPQDRYDSGPQYQQPPQPQGYAQPNSGPYGQQPPPQGGYPIHQEPPREYAFVSGGNFAVDPRSSGGRIPVTQGGQIPRADAYSQPGPNPSYPPQDNRSPYNQYTSQPPISSNQYAPQPSDHLYGRTPAQYDTPMGDYNDSRPPYHESSPFNQGPMSSAPPNPNVTAGVPPPARRDHRDDRRRDDRNDRHHRRQ